MSVRHDCKWTPEVLSVVSQVIADHELYGTAYDPFAGIGAGIADRVQGDARWSDIEMFGGDIEPDWAAAEAWIKQADALDPESYPADLDGILTSPTYANRMSGNYVGKPGDKRYGYAPSLGRALTEGSTAAHGWGEKYRMMHAQWLRLIKALDPVPSWFILNMKDHYRDFALQAVTQWWIAQARTCGWQMADCRTVPVSGMGFGQNGQDRTGREYVILFHPDPQRPVQS